MSWQSGLVGKVGWPVGFYVAECAPKRLSQVSMLRERER
jgi:hypothetical protein